MKEIDPFDAFVFPTKEFTKNSRYKIVRALGSIALIPLFPWTIFATVCILALVVFATIGDNLRDWWKKI